LATKLLMKNALRSLGLYPAAARANLYLKQCLGNNSAAAIGDRTRRIARHKNDLAFFRPFITANDLVFDIGAYYGNWTQVFLDLGATVVACEPQIDCLRRLRARQTARATGGRLTVLDCAVSASRGNGRFYVREARGTSGLLEDWHPRIRVERAVDVRVVTLDDLVDTYGVPRYCKIDVEGYEHEVLKGLTTPIPMMSLEYHWPPVCGIDKTVACLDYVSKFGKIRLNVTSGRQLAFLFTGWVDYEYFVEFFTQHLQNVAGFGEYGDIFIQVESS